MFDRDVLEAYYSRIAIEAGFLIKRDGTSESFVNGKQDFVK